MRKNDMHTQLEDLDIPDIGMPLYQAQIRARLLARARVSASQSFFGRLRHYSNYFSYMSTSKKLVPTGMIAALAIVAVVGFTFVSNSPKAYAQKIAQSGLSVVSQTNLPSNEVQAITNQFGSFQNAQTELENAINAGDLDVLSYDQFVAQSKASPASDFAQVGYEITQGASASTMSAQLANAKFLEFTDTNGAKTIIGVDANNAPFMFAQSKGGNTKVTPIRALNTQ